MKDEQTDALTRIGKYFIIVAVKFTAYLKYYNEHHNIFILTLFNLIKVVIKHLKSSFRNAC